MSETRKRYILWFFYAALFFACGYIFLRTDTFLLDDTEFHLLRLESLVDSIRHGDLFPKIYPELYEGYGYAIPLFYCNFFLYIPAALCLLGVPLLVSYNFYNLLLIAATLFFSYHAAKKITGSTDAGFFFSALYTGSAYFAVDLLKRGAVGETQAFVFAPLVLLGIYNSVYGNSKRNYALVFGFLALALSHLLSLLLFSLFYLAFLILNIGRIIKEPKRLLHIALAACAVMVLGAFYLFPLAEQMLTTRFFAEWHTAVFHPIWETISLKNLFVTLGSTQSTACCIGVTMLLAFVLRFFFKPLPKTGLEKFRDCCVVGGVFCLYAATAYFPWLRLDPYINIIQFPWRFFLPGTLLLAMAASIMLGALLKDKKRASVMAACLLCCLLCVLQSLYISVPEFKYQQSPPISDAHAGILREGDAFELVDENYLHINNDREFWAGRPFVPVSNYDDVLASNTRERTVTTVKFSGNTHEDAVLDLPLVYYLGYSAKTDDGAQLEIRPSEHGVLEVKLGALPSGTITVAYTGTVIQHISPWISVASIAAALWLYVKNKKESSSK